MLSFKISLHKIIGICTCTKAPIARTCEQNRRRQIRLHLFLWSFEHTFGTHALDVGPESHRADNIKRDITAAISASVCEGLSGRVRLLKAKACRSSWQDKVK